jgi:tight adherence protein B
VSLVVGMIAGVGILIWPDRFGRGALASLLSGPSASVPVMRWASGSTLVKARPWLQWLPWLPGRSVAGVSGQDLLGLLEAIAPALEAGLAPAAALRLAAEARAGSGRVDPLATLARGMASAAAEGAMLAPRWLEAAESAGSAEMLLLARAWSLTEDMGVPLAQAVRTTAVMLEARLAQERRLAGAVAGANATVNLLTVLPVAGPLLALVLGIGPGELYGGSSLTQASLVLGIALAVLGRWWVRRMVQGVEHGPVMR